MHFESEGELSWYTRDTGKYFPRDNAYAGGLLKFLLRRIFGPGTSNRRKRKRAQRRELFINLLIAYVTQTYNRMRIGNTSS